MLDRQRTIRRRAKADLQDLLSSIPDRADLETLFERRVDLAQILRLTGRQVSRQRIGDLLASPDLTGDLKKLLGS